MGLWRLANSVLDFSGLEVYLFLLVGGPASTGLGIPGRRWVLAKVGAFRSLGKHLPPIDPSGPSVEFFCQDRNQGPLVYRFQDRQRDWIAGKIRHLRAHDIHGLRSKREVELDFLKPGALNVISPVGHHIEDRQLQRSVLFFPASFGDELDLRLADAFQQGQQPLQSKRKRQVI